MEIDKKNKRIENLEQMKEKLNDDLLDLRTNVQSSLVEIETKGKELEEQKNILEEQKLHIKKLINSEKDLSQDYLSRFRKEAEISANLSRSIIEWQDKYQTEQNKRINLEYRLEETERYSSQSISFYSYL